MPDIVIQIFGFLGFLVSALGFLVFGFAGGRFVMDAFQKSSWQVQAALVFAVFGAVAGVASQVTPGSAGAFALGLGAAFFAASGGGKKDDAAKK